MLLRDPYVRDLIDREFDYRDSLTDGVYQEASYAARETYPAKERDPYNRPPPDYYRGRGAGAGTAIAASDNG
jgi:hypothetical protein